MSKTATKGETVPLPKSAAAELPAPAMPSGDAQDYPLPVIPSSEQVGLLKAAGQSISEMMLFDDRVFNKVTRMGELMASAKSTVPKHLQGNAGDCTAIIMQAMRWGLDPYAVAQKTHIVNGALGYEAQLVNAVLLKNAPISGRFSYEWTGPWDDEKAPEDKKKVTITFVESGSGEVKSHTIALSTAAVRNSPLWKADPKQQLAYLCMKRLARLYFPDVIAGVYTPDELEEIEPHRGPDNAKDITPPAGGRAASFAASAASNEVEKEEVHVEVEAENKTAAASPAPDEKADSWSVVKNSGEVIIFGTLEEAANSLTVALKYCHDNGKGLDLKRILELNADLIAEARAQLPDFADAIEAYSAT